MKNYGKGLIVLGLCAGLVSMVLNVWHVWHVFTWALPIVILTEAARMYIPFVAAEKGWNTLLKSVFVAVIVLCLFNSTSFLADAFVTKLMGRDKEVGLAAGKDAKIATLKADIAAITAQCTADVKAKLANCNLSHKALTDLANAEENRKDKPGCGKACQDFKVAAGTAERRETMETEVVRLETETAQAGVIETNGLGAALGWATGLGTEKGTVLVLTLGGAIFLYTIDLLVYLIIIGSQWVREDDRKAKVAALTGLDAKTVKIKVEGDKKVTKAEAYQAVIAYLLDMPEGSMLTSRRQLCKIVLGTEKRKTTFNEWMNDWIAKGDLDAVTKGKREVISLPSRAKTA